jgi:pimeloyl-ACP methyl ester carboxylesterase
MDVGPAVADKHTYSTSAAMGLTSSFFPSLSVRVLGAVDRLIIASLCLVQIAFLLIRHPLLFHDSLLAAAIRLFRLFLVSPIAIATLTGLLVGYLATGVVLRGSKSAERWNIPQTLIATGIAVAGGLVSIALFIPGLLLPPPWAYGFIGAGFILGPWLPGQFALRLDRLAAPSHEVSSRWPNRREVFHSFFPLLVLLAVWVADLASILSVHENRLFLNETRVANPDFPDNPSQDNSIKVARLSTGSIRYRDVNPRGRHVILGFPGWQESIYEFPPQLQTKLDELDVRGIVIERPGVGPVSTAWPGYGLAEWAGVVEEFDKTVLDSRPISIVGHSAGGVYALACAKLTCVRALGLVSSPEPITYGSFFNMFFVNTGSPVTAIAVQLFPHALLPELQRSCRQVLYDWKSARTEMSKVLGPVDAAFIAENDDAVRKNMVTAVLQGAAASADDGRGMFSPWPATLADTTRLPIIILEARAIN